MSQITSDDAALIGACCLVPGKRQRRIEVLIDAADIGVMAGRRWWIQKSGSMRYARTSERGINGRRCDLHKLLTVTPAGFEVDHANGNSFDNRRVNLRICTHAQNLRNRAAPANITGKKGVFISGRKFRAQIRVDGRSMRLGNFLTIEEAHEAYCAAARRYHGEFARF